MKNGEKKLRAFLDTLESKEAKVAFAARCGTTWNYLRLIPYGLKTPSESLAINLERETGGAVRVEDLRPDVDWEVIRRAA